MEVVMRWTADLKKDYKEKSKEEKTDEQEDNDEEEEDERLPFTIRSFVNGIPTLEGGSHVEGFKSALAKVLNQFAKSKVSSIKNKLYSLIIPNKFFFD